ncbi:hypothetical protein [Cryptosporangium sp. NPDC051539]|uniref:hypothetical protein n=1 Tax=Cryptosporangium sp. NPDC051539 TaxID=3363962 RepID=UPI00379BFDDC
MNPLEGEPASYVLKKKTDDDESFFTGKKKPPKKPEKEEKGTEGPKGEKKVKFKKFDFSDKKPPSPLDYSKSKSSKAPTAEELEKMNMGGKGSEDFLSADVQIAIQKFTAWAKKPGSAINSGAGVKSILLTQGEYDEVKSRLAGSHKNFFVAIGKSRTDANQRQLKMVHVGEKRPTGPTGELKALTYHVNITDESAPEQDFNKLPDH